MAFQKVEVPAGNYMGWSSTKTGQVFEGKVLEYDEVGGQDYAKKPCPLLTVELTRKATSVNKEGERKVYEPGDELSVTCGQANLKKSVKKAERDYGLKRGFMVRIELVGFEKVPDGTVKVYEVQVDSSTATAADDDHEARGGGEPAASESDEEPPF